MPQQMQGVATTRAKLVYKSPSTLDISFITLSTVNLNLNGGNALGHHLVP